MSKLVLMGSGETAPSLVPVHRQLLQGLSQPKACWIETPYGFQENADILSAKTCEFFQQAFAVRLQVAGYRHQDQPEVERQLAYGVARQCNYLFTGPGSPSYALRHWSHSEFPSLFEETLSQQQSVCVFASAAACAVGALCLPVYEIYKVGQEPHWLPGLDLLSRLGFSAVVLPHYNNTVGGNHDTRFCYLGERRLAGLEEQMEENLWIWGVDEHTAVILDLQQDTFEVLGKGQFTLRYRGQSLVYESGQRGSLQQLRQPGRSPATPPLAPLERASEVTTQGLILDQFGPLVQRFQSSLERADGLGAAQSLLDMEQLLQDWSGDTDVHHWNQARAQLRSLIARLGQEAQRGLQDPNERVGPFVQSLLDLREQARSERQFQRADAIRQQLLQAGVEVQDTPQGTRWSLRIPELN